MDQESSNNTAEAETEGSMNDSFDINRTQNPTNTKKRRKWLIVLVAVICMVPIVFIAVYTYRTQSAASPEIPPNYKAFETEDYSLSYPKDWVVNSNNGALVSPDYKVRPMDSEEPLNQGYAFLFLGKRETIDNSDTNPSTYETRLKEDRPSANGGYTFQETKIDGKNSIIYSDDGLDWSLDVYISNQVYEFVLSAPTKDESEAEAIFYTIINTIDIK